MNVLAPHPYVKKLERTLDRMGGLYLVQDIITAVKEGRMQMFCANDSIVVTQVIQFPRAKVLEVVVATGAIDDLRAVHDRILDYAKEEGASVVQTFGRGGWAPDAIKRGWKVKARSFLFQREM